MSQMQSGQIRRRGGELNVYTGLLFVATVILAVGCVILFMNNTDHSSMNSGDGGPFKVVADG